MATIKSRHGLGDESAPWANEVTNSVNGSLSNLHALRDQVERTQRTGVQTFELAGDRIQEMEAAWSTHPLTISTTSSTPQGTYQTLPSIQGPNWAQWAVIVGGTSPHLAGSGGSDIILVSQGLTDYAKWWALFTTFADGILMRPDGAIVPAPGGSLSLGWYLDTFGVPVNKTVSFQISINWVRQGEVY